MPERFISRRAAISMAALGGLALVSGCGASEPAKGSPRALKLSEAELLAVARYRVYEAKTVYWRLSMPGDPKMTADVRVDTRQQSGFGTVSTKLKGEKSQEGLLAWGGSRIGTAAGGSMAQPDDMDLWFARPMEQVNLLDLFLTAVTQLSSDRPENPQLLQQSSAQFLGTEEVGGVRCTVFSAPRPEGQESGGKSRTTYWVDAKGLIRKFAAHLDTSGTARHTAVMDDGLNIPELPAAVASLLSNPR